MSLLRAVPLCLLAFLAGCDSTSLRVDDVRRGFVYELVLEEVPAFQPDGNDWDGGITSPDPDVYLVLETRQGEIIAETAPLANVDSRDLPVVYGVPDVEVGINEEVFLVAYDDDGLLDDEFMDEIGPFRFGDYLEDDLGESFRVFSENNEMEVRVRLRWSD